MDALWRDGGWLIPAEVLVALTPKRDLRYTTVMTTLTRLEKKGRLERRKVGRAFAYHPCATRSEWAAVRMDAVLNISTDRSAALAHFMDRLDESDRLQLLRILNDRGHQ